VDTENNEAVETTETTEASTETRSLLESAASELGEGEYFLSDGVKGDGERPEWYKGDKYKTVAEQAKAYTELEKQFGSFTGAPKDGYAAPEGIEAEDELFNQLVEFGKETNMSQQGLEKAWELLSTQNAVSQEINQEAEMAKLGDNASERLQQVDTALKNKLGAKYDDVAPLITTAEDVILAETLIKSFAPSKIAQEGAQQPQGLTLEEVEKFSNAKDESGRLLRSTDAAYNAKAEQMWRDLVGDGEHRVVIG
jgi:hypothetical protein